MNMHARRDPEQLLDGVTRKPAANRTNGDPTVAQMKHAIYRPINFCLHFTRGIVDVCRGKPWRRSFSEAEAFVDNVWQEGDSSLSERDRHFFQVGATYRGKRITDEQHFELCDSVVRGLELDSKVRPVHRISRQNATM